MIGQEIDFSKVTVTTEQRPDVLCNCKKSCDCEPVKCLPTNVLQLQYATMLLNIVTSWQKILSDKVVPSEKLVKETIDQVKEDCTYTAGEGITIIDNVISSTTAAPNWGSIQGDIQDLIDLQAEFNTKLNKLNPGQNVSIIGNTISAKDTTYTAGTGISISSDNVISNTQTSAEWGKITGDILTQSDLQTEFATKQNKLTAGLNIQIIGDKISATDTIYDDTQVKADIASNTTKIGLEETARISADSNLLSQINTKLNILTPGLNILINGDTISATDTKYTAGSNVQINGTIISATDTIYDDTLIKLDLEDTQHTTATILNTFHQILQWQNE